MTARLPENLDLIATAPEGIRKLRGLILELAVRGKLVAQDPNDEPASELLKRVDAERKRLKMPPRPPGDDAPEPFSVPKGWQWLRFGDVAQHNSGKTLDKGRNTGHSRHYITTSNLYWGRFDLANVREMPIRDEELERCTARRNDLLIFEGGEAGRAAVWDADEEICFQNHVHRARFFAGINPYYAYRILQRLDLSGEINQFRKGVGISNLSGKALATIPFPVPPLAEQHRIVAKVDELMALCDRLDAEQADAESAQARLVDTLLGTLTQSADATDLAANWQRLAEHFDTLFTTESSLDALKQTVLQLAVMGKLVPQDPNDEPARELLKRIAHERARLDAEGVRNKSAPLTASDESERSFPVPKGWAVVTLPDLCRIGGGATPSKEKASYWGKGVPWVSPKDMKVDEIIDAQDHVTELALNETSLSRIPKESLLVVVRGMILAHSFPVAVTKIEVAINQDMKSLSAFRSEVIPFLALVCKGYKSKILDLVERSTHGTCKLQSQKLFAFLFGLPPLAEQHRIVAKVDELLTLVDRLQADLAESGRRQERLAATLIDTALLAA